MYAQQANTGIAPLDAVLATAQMITPDGGNTVAAQVAQAAQQKMQPQGIMGGMPQARQDFRTAAEIDNMKRMQMQQAMQQMAAQMTARPAGIEELPAKNMRDMQRMAGGGVIGFDGRGEFGSYVPEAVALDELRVAEAKRKREEEQEKLKQEFLRSAGVEIPATPAVQSPILTRQQQESMVKPSVSKSYASGIDEVLAAANRASAPAPRPPAAPAASTAVPQTRGPATGVAALVARPTMDLSRYEKAGAEDRSATQQIIAAQEANAAAKAAYMAGRPKFEQEGIAALTKANQAREELLAKERADDAYRRQQALLDQIGRRNLSAYRQEEDRQRQRDLMAAEAQRLYEQAVIKQREAEFLQGAGRFEEAKKALDDKEKILSAMHTRLNQARQTEAGIAEREFAGAVQMYEGAQNREANRKLEEYRRQTQLMKPHEIQMIEGLKKDKLDQLTGGKPETATAEQRVEATEFALQTVKGAPRAESLVTKANTAALREIAEWEKGPGANIKAMNAKNPQVYEDARRAKIREINATLGSTIPLDGGAAGAVDTNNPLLKK